MGLGDTLSVLLKTIQDPFARTNQDLIVLRVMLTLADGKPWVAFDLTGYGAIGEPGRRTWLLDFAEIGISEKLGPEAMLNTALPAFPLQLREGLKAGLALMNPTADLPLWLDLVRPYGFLGILPWERLLGELLHRPVLRLPDFLVPPRENADVLEAAILFDPPPSSSPEQVTGQFKGIVDEMLAGSPRAQTRIHVFSPAAIGKILAGVKRDKRIIVYDASRNSPDQADPDKQGDAGAASPWFDWVCKELNGRSLDAVHFVCGARATESVASLVFCRSPSSLEPQTLRSVNAGEIGRALTRVGAWAAIFTPSRGEPEGAAMAFVADTFAQTRPGSVLFHPAAPDSASGFRESIRFLFSPEPTQPPKLLRGFMYCQPAAVAAHAGFRSEVSSATLPSDLPEFTKQASWVDRTRARVGAYIPALEVDLKQPPNWASAMQRYLESATLKQISRASADVLSTKSAAAADQLKSAAQSETVRKTLSGIQDIVGDYLKKSGL